MDDSFLAEATDLGRILDELEENESPPPPKPKIPSSTKNKDEKKNISYTALATKEVTHPQFSVSEPTWDAIGGKLTNGITHKPATDKDLSPSSCDTGMLIDFGDVEIEPPITKNTTEEKVVIPASLSEVDFLLSLTEVAHQATEVKENHNFVDDHMKEDENVVKTQEKDVVSENNHAVEATTNTEVAVSKSTKNSDISEKVVGFNSNVHLDSSDDEALLNEFENFLSTEEFPSSANDVAVHSNINRDQIQLTTDILVEKSKYTKPTDFTTYQNVDSISTNIAEIAADHVNEEPAPVPNTEINVFSQSSLSPQVENLDSSEGQTVHSNTDNISNLVEVDSVNNDSLVSNDYLTTMGEELIQEVQEDNPEVVPEDQSEVVPADQTSLSNSSNSPAIDMGDGIREQSYPSFSPPSYSAVLAEDRAAHHTTSHKRQEESELHQGDQTTSSEAPPISLNSTENTNSLGRSNQINTHETSVVHSQIPRPGLYKPRWVPDKESPACTKCGVAFSFTRRRHHCRACGQVFCNTCCNEKSKLEYMEFAEARVCMWCYAAILQADALAEAAQRNSEQASTSSPQMPSPPSSGPRPVLKPNDADDSTNGSSNHKSVRFSDGTKPDHPSTLPDTPPLPSRMQRASRTKQRNASQDRQSSPFPPVIVDTHSDGTIVIEEYPDEALITTLLQPDNSKPLRFALSPNLFVSVCLFKYQSTPCYYFVSHGLDTVGQAEVAFIFNVGDSTSSIPTHAFTLFSYLFTNSRKGKAVHALDFVLGTDIVSSEDAFFGIPDMVGLLFVRKTCQVIDIPEETDSYFSSLTVKASSTLFALLVHKSEKPWASLFPSRLLIGLGASTKQFPYPLVNFLKRSPVYPEVGNTILGILCDFRNFKYKVITVPGLSVVIQENGILINIPANRFNDIAKILNSSNEHVLALGSDAFSVDNDEFRSHLVSIQDHANLSYRTEVLHRGKINSNHDQQQQTGAAFVVFNGSLKSGHTQQARCTIVEDGVMVQILPEKMASLKESLKAMDDFMINCNQTDQALPPATADPSAPPKPNCKFVELRWVADDTKFNIGLSSPIDFLSFEGILGYNVQGKSEKKGKQQLLRWNQVFFFKSTGDVLDMSRLAEQMADGCFQALVPNMKMLRSSKQTKIGIRFTIHPDDVGYAVGSQGLPLPDACLNALDEHLVFLLHDASAHLQPDDDVVVFELIFSVLEMRSSWRTIQ
uniref:Zinc finger FYVE domain-containing protein 16 n=1 Tax=Phallusia mammillata TaxID=59560 RepID=A0A6F9DY56_9ASCI|nr:zinc finger FYVE domain-containing protein 16 [Phallusia mammillata]